MRVSFVRFSCYKATKPRCLTLVSFVTRLFSPVRTVKEIGDWGREKHLVWEKVLERIAKRKERERSWPPINSVTASTPSGAGVVSVACVLVLVSLLCSGCVFSEPDLVLSLWVQSPCMIGSVYLFRSVLAELWIPLFIRFRYLFIVLRIDLWYWWISIYREKEKKARSIFFSFVICLIRGSFFFAINLSLLHCLI